MLSALLAAFRDSAALLAGLLGATLLCTGLLICCYRGGGCAGCSPRAAPPPAALERADLAIPLDYLGSGSESGDEWSDAMSYDCGSDSESDSDSDTDELHYSDVR